MILERALDLGRLVGQSDEYQALKRAGDRLSGDGELKQSLERLRTLQVAAVEQADRGEPSRPEQEAELESLLGRVQTNPLYQALVAAQANFDKLMYRINQQILEGMKRGAESRIITLG